MMTQSSVILFLVVNKTDVLPIISIESALRNSEFPIIIAYINLEDVADLPRNPRITLLDLKTLENCVELVKEFKGENYVDFSSEKFYRIVKLKWYAIKYLLENNYSYIVYSDSDVIWFADAAKSVTDFMSNHDNYDVSIQDSTLDMNRPRLCMGFFVLKNTKRAFKLVNECLELNEINLMSNKLYGDDDAVTQWFIENLEPNWVYLLPQNLYPLGFSLDLFSKKSNFPHLHRIRPEIFHLNFVIGNRNKILLAYALAKSSNLNIEFRFNIYVVMAFQLKKIRRVLGRITILKKLKKLLR